MVYRNIPQWLMASFEEYIVNQIGGKDGLPDGAIRCSCENGAIVQQVDASLHISELCLKCSVSDYVFRGSSKDIICDINR